MAASMQAAHQMLKKCLGRVGFGDVERKGKGNRTGSVVQSGTPTVSYSYKLFNKPFNSENYSYIHHLAELTWGGVTLCR